MTDTAPPLAAPRDPKLREMANALRALAMDAVEKAKSGHPGMPMGMADIAAVLFTKYLRYDPQGRTGPTATALYCRTATARCCSMGCST
jgi:transketolase N-terminal domain/subunit